MHIDPAARAAARESIDCLWCHSQPKKFSALLACKRRKSHNHNLSAATKAKIDYAICRAWADSTLLKYSQGLDAHQSFCDAEGSDHSQRLSANKFLLCAFAVSHVGEIASGTARSSIAAVKAWHILDDAEWEGGIRLCYVLRGVENAAPADSKQDARPPVTSAMLDALDTDLDHNDPKDAAVFAVPCCAFWGQIRLGEMLSDAQDSFKSRHIPTAADLNPPSTPAGSRLLHLPWTKTKRSRGDDTMLCRQDVPSGPIRAVEEHLKLNDIPDHLPLFSYCNGDDQLLCLTRKKMMQRCNEVWTCRGHPAITGHSFRIGGTTELLLAGVHPDVVQAMGRWKSDAFKVYWCRLDLLAPLHSEFVGL